MGGHRMLVSILKSWLVIHVRGEKFLSSVITFKVFEPYCRSTAQIKAHKNILMARSVFFWSLFKSGMKESVSNKVELDDDPAIFKELLKFLYSGLLPGNMDEIATKLLPVADKYAVEELKELCKLSLRRNLSAKSVVQVMQLADNHNCPDLFESAAPIFKENLKDLDQSSWDELEKESKLLVKLLKIAAE